MGPATFEKAKAELPILRRFIDFVNRQIGVYCDALASFNGNEVRIERQIPRVQRPAGRRIEEGRPVIVSASVDDPASPDVIHHRTVRADEFVAANAEAGFNEQQVCWAIIVFTFACWDQEIRPQIARVRGVTPNEVMIDELGDLRTLRKSIVHEGGHLSGIEHAKLNVMSNLCKPDAPIRFTHNEMHKLFVHVKQGIGRLILEYIARCSGPSEIVGIGIENA